ncbi:MAG: NUDIX domain-containing protein [bacterium]|nr:NUDIX domain-containing protein [bacterium]
MNKTIRQSRRVRAIIVKDDKLLTIKRTKVNDEYWVLPGGGIEPGETTEQALVREIKEETGLDCVVGEYVANYPYKTAQVDHDVAFYRATITGGTFGNGTGPEFTHPQNYTGTHEAQWIALSAVPTLELRPREIRDRIVQLFT